MIPRAVIEAGRAERESFGYLHSPLTKRYVVTQGTQTWYFEALREVQDFLDDRVFRTMLRALADMENIDLSFRFNLLALAGKPDESPKKNTKTA